MEILFLNHYPEIINLIDKYKEDDVNILKTNSEIDLENLDGIIIYVKDLEDLENIISYKSKPVFLLLEDKNSILKDILNYQNVFDFVEIKTDHEFLNFKLMKFFNYIRLDFFAKNNDARLTGIKKLQAELNLSHKIHSHFKTSTFPSRESVEIVGKTLPSNNIGGDFFDVINISEDEIFFVIGEISGGGLRASIVMILILSYIKTLIHKKTPIHNIMETLNVMLCEHTDIFLKVSCIMGLVNIKEMKLKYCNAGHKYSFVINEDNSFMYLAVDEKLLGEEVGHEYEVYSHEIDMNSSLICHTDGILQFEKSFFDVNLFVEKYGKFEVLDNALNNLMNYYLHNSNNVDNKTILALKFRSKIKTEYPIKLSILSSHYEYKNVKILLNEIYEELNLSLDLKFKINFAVNEVVTNSIQHAYMNNKGKIDLTFVYIKNENSLKIIIRDYGIGISEKALRRIFKPSIDPYVSKGKGLFLSRKMVDSLKIDSVKSNGTRIEIIKNLSDV